MSFLAKILKVAAERGAKTVAEDLAVKAAKKAPARAASTVVRKPKAVINFGLVVDADMPGGPGRVKAAEVKRAIRSTGRKIVQSEVRKSGTEPTLIALLDKPLTSEEMAQLTKQFNQKAMAHVDSKGAGVIDGQMKDAWDPYDAKYMMLPGGETVADLEPLIPATTRVPATAVEHRKTELPKVESLSVGLRPRQTQQPEDLSIFDLEGKPFITSMSDLSAAGDEITSVNDADLSAPVRRMGGQDYMFDAPNSVWASDLGPAGAHMALARQLRASHGQNPVFLPWTMGAKAVDFAHMPRELMLRYAADTMGKRDLGRLNRDVAGIVPDFRSADDPASYELFREASGSQRAALNRLLDQYRTRGGLGMGEARAAITDPAQIGAPLTSLRNVGMIDAASVLEPSTHPSYRTSLPGEGVGRLRETVGALELLPELMARGSDDPFDIPIQPREVQARGAPLRALQMKPRSGVITDKLLRGIERRTADKPRPPVRKKRAGGRVSSLAVKG